VLFRIVQESLTNVSRHRERPHVQILLDHDRRAHPADVEDDGVGFDVDAARRRKTFGLLGKQERVIMLRGELKITQRPPATAPASPCPCRSSHEGCDVHRQLPHRPVAGRDCRRYPGTPFAAFSPPTTHRRHGRSYPPYLSAPTGAIAGIIKTNGRSGPGKRVVR